MHCFASNAGHDTGTLGSQPGGAAGKPATRGESAWRWAPGTKLAQTPAAGGWEQFIPGDWGWGSQGSGDTQRLAFILKAVCNGPIRSITNFCTSQGVNPHSPRKSCSGKSRDFGIRGPIQAVRPRALLNPSEFHLKSEPAPWVW